MTLANSLHTRNDAQHLVDVSIDCDWCNAQVGLFGRNPLDEDGFTIGFDVGGVAAPASLWTYAAPRDPRTFGVQLVYDF